MVIRQISSDVKHQLLSEVSINALLTVQKLEYGDTPTKVYNFEVADTHTYVVGTSQALVHNTCPPWGSKVPQPRGGNVPPNGRSRDYVKDHLAGILARQKVSVDDMMELVPRGIKNTWKPSAAIPDGFRYEFRVTLSDGSTPKITIRAHEPNPNAPVGSYSSQNWTGTISVGGSNLRTNGQWSSNNSLPDVHLPF